VSRWYRAYEGTVNDPKLAEAAAVADVSKAVSVAAWHALLESAAAVNNCGSYEITPRRVSIILCEPTPAVEALFAAYAEVGLIEDGVILAWKRRQFESDDSKERVARYRAKRKENADVTACNGDVTPPEAETETEEESSYEDTASGDAPKLTVEHVFEGYQDLARALGLTVPRDLTPERRQLLRGRVNQYPLEDFLTVFQKCRDSPFLRGERGNGTPLKFDWLFKKANFQKVLEGNYD
jgi:hypothetical protein